MKLYEFEGHKILKKVGINVPDFVVVSDLDEVKQARKRLKFPIVAKVQVLSGKRGKSGGVKICTTQKQLISFTRQHLGKEFLQEQVRFIVLAEKVEIAQEHYISITYDTVSRTPFLLFSRKGGVDIEDVKRADPEQIVRVEIDVSVGPSKKDLEKAFFNNYSSSDSEKNKLSYSSSEERSDESRSLSRKFSTLRLRSGSNNSNGLVDLSLRLLDAFTRYDCRLVEVNPLVLIRRTSRLHPRGEVKVSSGEHPGGELSYVAIDAKVILDDAGLVRHHDLDVLPKGAISAIPAKRELEAKAIDEEDYRGSAGSTFIELDGDIAILASGGGASLLVMDSVVAAGGKPANYTEYSGNPPREKVEKLTKITLSREGLSGCLVAGAVANFTDIYETLGGFVDGLRQTRPKPKYPIVIRRGGPRQKEAYEMLEKVAKKEGWDIHLFGPEAPISVACQKMVELAEQFKNENLKIKN